MVGIGERLGGLEYPGRGLVVGRTSSGRSIEVFFICGRSDASKERRAEITPQGVDIMSSVDATNDPLRHYSAMWGRETWSAVGNGSHVQQMCDALVSGTDPLTAWRTHRSEPDELATPRIVGATQPDGGGVIVASVRRSDVTGEDEHILTAADDLPAGFGYLVHTYKGSVASPESDACPRGVELVGELPEVAQSCWEALPPNVRVLLIGRELPYDPAAVVTLLSSAQALGHEIRT